MPNQFALAPAESTASDLFVLTDEQILDIAPETQDVAPDPRPVTRENKSVSRDPWPVPRENQEPANTSDVSSSDHGARDTGRSAPSSTSPESLVTSHHTAEPPPWLAAQMKDPWGGEEAREFWDGVLQARSEAAAYQAYRAAIASPEDARALKELYPGGVSEARTAAERARLLDQVDRAYFGAAGNSPEQISASRAQLAQRMLREDPVAFREMVEVGLRALEAAEKGTGAAPSGDLPRMARVLPELSGVINLSSRPERPDQGRAAEGSGQGAASLPRSLGSAPQNVRLSARDDSVLAHGGESRTTSHQSLSAYAAFERAANEDLERSVGGAIERTLTQALPVAQLGPSREGAVQGDAQARVPALRERLATSVRAEVERALQGDRQLGEQVAQILASRRFDDNSRGQIVRLISERAQQLVPGAAKRVLNEWTQTTLAAHRGRSERVDAASARADVALASAPTRPAGGPGRAPAELNSARQHDLRRTSGQGSTRPASINYRKLSDEQILEM